MLAYLLYALFFISCIVLIATVLLQPGKTDAGALFTSNISSSAFGPRGTQTILSKITIAAAATFFISALLLAMPAITGNISVLQTVGESPAAPTDVQQEQQSPVIDPQQNLFNTNTNAGENNPANVNAAVTNTNVSMTNAGANSNAANANR
ncbi:MAG TPA: preprotein translocase subunit SecG [Pyrinomonadaceae bacterium]|nr:preprotein translocase subunit SecG [Pyrinomonadaceae bacterium]